MALYIRNFCRNENLICVPRIISFVSQGEANLYHDEILICVPRIVYFVSQ